MMIYKEMEYQWDFWRIETLAEGKVGDYKWLVLSLGKHPCGYVAVPKNHPFYGKDYFDIENDIEVHGGLTFSGRLKDSNDYWFGWDYAHAGDYTCWRAICGDGGDKKWTTKEIVDECFNVIEQFRSCEEK